MLGICTPWSPVRSSALSTTWTDNRRCCCSLLRIAAGTARSLWETRREAIGMGSLRGSASRTTRNGTRLQFRWARSGSRRRRSWRTPAGPRCRRCCWPRCGSCSSGTSAAAGFDGATGLSWGTWALLGCFSRVHRGWLAAEDGQLYSN